MQMPSTTALRRLIVSGLNNLGMACTEPHGAFYAFPCVGQTGMDDNTFAEVLLKEERVAVIPDVRLRRGGHRLRENVLCHRVREDRAGVGAHRTLWPTPR